MHSSEKNVSSYYETNSTGPSINQNKQRFLSFINASNLSPKKFKILNIINSMNLNNINKKINSNSILNKVLINQSKQENILSIKLNKESSFQSDIKTNGSDIDNIFLKQIQNKQKYENFLNKTNHINNNNDNNNIINNNIINNNIDNNINNNIINNKQLIINEKTKKINYALESHQLINSLLKNQNKNTVNNNRSKITSNNPTSELSFSSSFDNYQNLKKNELSPSKDSIEFSSNINQNDSFSKNLYLQYWNSQNRDINQNTNSNKDALNNFSYETNNNIYFGLNKDINNDNKILSQHIQYNNNTSNNRNKKYSNSPLRMADVFMLKKHHSINPYDTEKKDKGNYVETITFNNSNMKKIIFIKSSESKLKNDESKNEDEIKVIRQKDKKENKTEIKEMKEKNNKESENKTIEKKEEIKEYKKNKDIKSQRENKEKHKYIETIENDTKKENKENKEIKVIKELKENNINIENIDIKENIENEENKENKRNDIIKLPRRRAMLTTKNETKKDIKDNNNENISNIRNIFNLKMGKNSPLKNFNQNMTKNNILIKERNNDELNISKTETSKIIIKTNKIKNNIYNYTTETNNKNKDIKKCISPRNNIESNYFSNIVNDDEKPLSIRRRFMNSKNKNNFTPDIEIRNSNKPYYEKKNINTLNENTNGGNINKEKYKGMKSFENIKKKEPFKINIALINNKEAHCDKNEELIRDYTSEKKEKSVLINKRYMDTEKEIRKLYFSPSKDKIDISSKNKKEKEKNKTIENNTILSDDEKAKDKEKFKRRYRLNEKEKEKSKEKEKEKEKEKKKENQKEKEKEKEKENEKDKKNEDENEDIIKGRKFQSESEKEKRMRRARKYLQREDKFNKDDNNNTINNNNNKQKNGEENEKNNEEKEKIEELKINKSKILNKNHRTIEKNNTNTNTYSNNNNQSKEKNTNCFSMENLFGIKKQNKAQLNKDNKNKEDYTKNYNSYSQKSITSITINEDDKSNTLNSNSKRLKYKAVKKEINKEEEIMKNEEENKNTKETIEDNDKNDKWKRRRKDMIPRKLKNKISSLKLRNKNNLNLNDQIIIEDMNSNREINNKNSIRKHIGFGTKKKRITILEDVLVETIDTTKPVVQINLCQMFMKYKLDNNKDSQKYKNIFLFGFDKKNNFFIQFDLRKKKFLRIKIPDIEDLSDSFQKEFIYQNTILYNTLTGVFILTGKNCDILYYYNPINETMIKVCKFNNGHNLGCLLLDQENNRILVIGGKNTNMCESYTFDSKEIRDIPNLNFDRCNASFIISNDKIYGFFGFSFKKGKNLFNIEYIDKNILDKWDIIDLNFEYKKDLLPFHLKNISTFNYENDPNKIIIYGGKQGRSELIVDNYYYIYDIEQNKFEKIEGLFYNIIKDFKGINIWKKSELIENEDKKGFFFDKQKQILELPEDYKVQGVNEITGAIIDSECNIHFLTKKQKYFNVYKFIK